MNDRIFLPDIASSTSGRWEVDNLRLAQALSLQAGDLPQMFVVESGSGPRFFQRGCFGWPKALIASRLTDHLVMGVADIFPRDLRACQWTLARGGIYFRAGDAFAQHIPGYQARPLADTTIEVQRYRDNGGWKAHVNPTIKPMVHEPVIVIGEGALASGASLCQALDHIHTTWLRAKAKGVPLEPIQEIWLFVASGSLHGAIQAHHKCQELGGWKLTVVFSQAIIDVVSIPGNLGLPYTDLPILADRTICSQVYYTQAHAECQGKLICSCGDVGDSMSSAVALYVWETIYELFAVAGLRLTAVDPGIWTIPPALITQACPWTLEYPPDKKDLTRLAQLNQFLQNWPG